MWSKLYKTPLPFKKARTIQIAPECQYTFTTNKGLIYEAACNSQEGPNETSTGVKPGHPDSHPQLRTLRIWTCVGLLPHSNASQHMLIRSPGSQSPPPPPGAPIVKPTRNREPPRGTRIRSLKPFHIFHAGQFWESELIRSAIIPQEELFRRTQTRGECRVHRLNSRWALAPRHEDVWLNGGEAVFALPWPLSGGECDFTYLFHLGVRTLHT
jgi:hypothetical protein